ncbi:arginine--tRNA ligase [Zobellia galactanivorans]|uniref:arginine--tRNA ligase n=1 Tax=Zobellia TaxID=112040 RepID=UPI000B530C3E|nr:MULTISPECIES: arginine--tRNA ligase [Zobellia]MBU3027664.1 arginine--tRNA ligase [Zobellia galactanivorans]MDO6807045.1 arginine--tRNA ligase [Zobellia galactanivorans]OWW23948.1 arginine--tRNA ligase [Zobellia sp. OII3]
MGIQAILEAKVKEAIAAIFNVELPSVEFQPTRKDFEGDVTIVVFPMLRFVKGNPVQIGEQIGAYLEKEVAEVTGFNVIKGFLNLVIGDGYYLDFFNGIKNDAAYGFVSPSENDAIMVEYSSPNTNKPLHLGHIRNNLLGYSVAEILKASGKKVYKTQIINDRGIHICKSMLAWQRFGNGETPESTGLKGDKLVGNYYVAFDKAYKAEIAEMVANGTDKKVAEKEAPILLEAQEMLQKWEAGDEGVVALWKEMNAWVYKGFDVTYKNLGVDFDTLYYESNTYLLGKDVVAEGLEKGVFFRKEDGSVWIDLTDEGLDEKIVLRSDGTAVYMTQDIGTAIQRVKDYPDVGGMVYTVGNEQDYHFKVLFLILKKLGFSWSENLHHLSYGMVDLPSGKMKSREGTVVDADDLMDDMTNTAAQISEELGKLEGYSEEEKNSLYKLIGLGALKYYILKVDPKKRILFDPEESVDFQGNTGPFIQYTYARIQSILRKADFDTNVDVAMGDIDGLHNKEKELIKQLQLYPETVQLAAENYSPALIANYTYDLVKEFNSFYQQVSILGETDAQKKLLRVQLSKKVSEVIASAFGLLGIDVPERM